MADDNNNQFILNIVEEETRDIYARREDARKAAYKEDLQAELNKQEISAKRRKQLQTEANKLDYEEKKANFQKQIQEARTVREKEDAERHLRDLERERQKQDIQENAAKKVANYFISAATGAVDKLYTAMSNAGKEYANYVDKIQVRLLGANETVGSITSTLSKAFGASPFFQMKTVMDKAVEAVQKGISFNVEARAAMAVLSDKVAATFDAFDSSLLRLIKIQQSDSTQARLGIESMLTEFLNRNFQDTSYLADNINSAVTRALLEAESLYTKQAATQLDYITNKWLGSLYSVGVSQELVNQLAQGIGYLASGDVQSLSSNAILETLLVTMANRGGVNYGDLLTRGVVGNDISNLFTGLRSLISEISANRTNIVALNQYAKTFGLTVSDVQALMNISDKSLREIAKDMGSYSTFTQRVLDETSFSKLYSRTGGGSLAENLYQNFLFSTGQSIGSSPGAYLAWQTGDLVAGLAQGIYNAVHAAPLGLGVETGFQLDKIIKAGYVTGGALAGIVNLVGSLNSMTGVNVSALTQLEEQTRLRQEEQRLQLDFISRLAATTSVPAQQTQQAYRARRVETEQSVQQAITQQPQADVVRGDLVSYAQAGERQTQSAYVGDYSEGAIAKQLKETSDQEVAKYQDENYNEQEQKISKAMESLPGMREDLQFIAQLLNKDGIVVRGRTGFVEPVVYQPQTEAASPDIAGRTIIGVIPY